jgi:hypothetical protein
MMGLVLPGEGSVFRKDLYFEQTGYTPHRGQSIIHYDSTRHRVLCNGRRWGKTLLGGKEAETMAFIRNFLGQPCQGWIIGPEYADCEKEFRVLYNTFKALGVDMVSSKFLNNVENGTMHIKTNWGFDVQCRSARHPESLVGEGLDFVLMVEAGRHKKRMFTEYVRPALSDKRGWSMASGVPEEATDQWLLYWAFNRGQHGVKPQWKSWRMPSWTNRITFPGGRNDPEILEAEDDLTEDEFERQYGAKFVQRIGRVMKEWDDDVHLVAASECDYDPHRGPLFAALDYGYTNAWVWLWIQLDVWGNIYVIGEERFFMRDTEDIVRREFRDTTDVKKRAMLDKLVAIYCPPAEPDDTNVVKRVLQKPVRTNTGGEIKPRMAMIRSALKPRPEHLPDDHPEKRPLIIFNRETTTQLAWEMREGYRWPEHQSEVKNPSENPLDKDNHGPEALSRFFKGHMERFDKIRKSRQSTVKKKVA